MRNSIEIGQNIGPFVVVAKLGRGGMATVYSAYEPGLDREVALKVLPLDLLEQPGFSERFEREARLIAKLEHPHIVPLYGYGIDDGIPWMALRLVRGGNLGERLERSPPGRETGLAYFTMIADALDHAHSLGVVHRDLKPQNVLLGERGELYLADFGIARLLQGRTLITNTGAVLGTPQYMSPEQAQDGEIGPATDIYALGVMVYQWLTGILPFDADTPYAVMYKHVNSPLALEPLEKLPVKAREVLIKALAKTQEQRWSSAGLFIEALADAMHGPTVDPVAQAGNRSGPESAVGQPAVDSEAKTRIAAPVQAAISARKLEKVPKPPSFDKLEFRDPAALAAKPAVSRRPLLIGGGSVLGMVVLAALLFGGGREPPPEPIAAPEPAAPPLDPEPVELGPPGRLLIDTDAECRLVVDGEDKGVLKPGAGLRLELPAGDYTLACTSSSDASIELRQTATVVSDKADVAFFALQSQVYIREQARLAEQLRQQEQTRQAEAARKAEEARVAAERQRLEDEARKRREALQAEETRLLDEARKAAEARKREEAKRLEAARKALGQPATNKPAAAAASAAPADDAEAEAARKLEAARRAEAARKAEQTRLAEAARLAEEARLAEAARLAEEARKAEEARLAAEAAAKARIPVPLSTPQPDYPIEALRSQTTGEVEVEITIARDGSVRDVRVLRASPRGVFERSVLSSVRRWRYQPLPEEVKLMKVIVFR